MDVICKVQVNYNQNLMQFLFHKRIQTSLLYKIFLEFWCLCKLGGDIHKVYYLIRRVVTFHYIHLKFGVSTFKWEISQKILHYIRANAVMSKCNRWQRRSTLGVAHKQNVHVRLKKCSLDGKYFPSTLIWFLGIC